MRQRGWRSSIRGAQFNLPLTDLIMPGGMNGRELAEAVR